MLRRDFISKIIEQMVNAVARLIKIDIENDQEKFLGNFDEFLSTYFQISDKNLTKLLEENEERDEFLLDEKLKNQLMLLFVQAGFVFQKSNQSEKAKSCLKIIERIQNQHSDIYEFPSEETEKLGEKMEELKNGLKTK